MIYTNPKPYIHVFTDPLPRQKCELEIVLTNGGSWFEPEENRGQKHLLEHCIVSRTKDMDFLQLRDYVFRENLALNAYTSPLSMGFEASSHHSDFEKIVDILFETAFAPTLVEEDLEREKEIVLREISERRGDPNYTLHFDTIAHIFTPDSLKNHQVLGDAEKVAKTTVEDFQKLHIDSLQKSHVFVLASGGGIDLEYLTQKIQSLEAATAAHLYRDALHQADQKLPVNYDVANTFFDFRILPIVHPLGHQHAELTLVIPCKVTFENLPARAIFLNLFLQYDGILYHRLRNERGLIYSLQSQFTENMQALQLSLACEVRHIQEIILEIEEVFSNFETYFKPDKFSDYKKIVQKKADISMDTPGRTISHAQNILHTYGQIEDYLDYIQRLDSVNEADIEGIYQSIGQGLTNKKVIAVSKDPELSKTLPEQ